MPSLTQKEESFIKDLQSQEKLCIQKYERYSNQANDPELKDLFNYLKENEQSHYNALDAILKGECGESELKRCDAATYSPKASYNSSSCEQDKDSDQFLCTDSIATEKYVATAYNDDLFQFASNDVRSTLNHIQTDEQNHAEMIYKYKVANGMA